MTIYFDTETTGLAPGRILQLSYVLDYKDKVIGKNFFFYVDYVPEEAVKVHGFTVEKLAVLSGGKTFSDYSEEIYKDFITADLIIAHNVKFDLSFLQAEFCYLDEIFKYNASLDTMKYFTPVTCLPRRSGGYKYPKLNASNGSWESAAGTALNSEQNAAESHSHSMAHTHTQGATGSSSSIQPYITCYMWKRTA